MRVFRVLVASVLVGVVVAGGASAETKIPRVGIIIERLEPDPYLGTFRAALQELGYVDGRNVHIEYRYGRDIIGRSGKVAAELLRLPVDVIVVGGTVSARAAKAETTTVPIVFVLAGDPVGSGLVASLARPGGNATGLSNVVAELGGKQLELLRSAAPSIKRVGVVLNPDNAASLVALKESREAARTLGLELQVVEARTPADVTAGLDALATARIGGLLAISDATIGSQLGALTKFALRHRVPSIYAHRQFAEAGGLLTYGPSFSAQYRRAASYVARILKGAKPGDLPVEQPTTFELVINLKTAQAIGITIAPALLSRADQVIR
jgi:putative ABC transport system substrate-binding protein